MYIDVGTIVNQEVYKQISQYTTCVICEGIAWNPVQCESCENCFCEECLVKWQKESKHCPFRCLNATYKKNKIINKLLSQLELNCQNGCGQVIKYDNLLNHYESECLMINYKEKIEEMSEKLKQMKKKTEEMKEIGKYMTSQIDYFAKCNKLETKTGYCHHHSHVLIFGKRNNFWICDICNQHYRDVDKSFCCKQCDFDICCSCYLQEVFKIK